jgi:hypothetical protein
MIVAVAGEPETATGSEQIKPEGYDKNGKDFKH